MPGRAICQTNKMLECISPSTILHNCKNDTNSLNYEELFLFPHRTSRDQDSCVDDQLAEDFDDVKREFILES